MLVLAWDIFRISDHDTKKFSLKQGWETLWLAMLDLGLLEIESVWSVMDGRKN